MWLALTIFVASYALIAGLRIPGLPLDRTKGALAGAIGMVALGVVPFASVLQDAIDLNTLLLLLGMMVVSAHLEDAGLFARASWLTLTHVRSPRRLLWALVFVAGVLSAVLVNDTVCLMFTPMVVRLARDARIKPLPMLLALAFGANAGSVATPTGNPQNMIIGTMSGISYARFTGALALPAMAALVTVGALLSWLFRDEIPERFEGATPLERPIVDRRRASWSLGVLGVTLLAFVAGAPMAWTAVAAALVLLVGVRTSISTTVARVDFALLLFFASLFIVVHGAGRSGVASWMFAASRPMLGADPAQQAVAFGLFTVAASQVVSNVPFVMLAGEWMREFADPRFMWLSTALFSTLAGNLTIVGSVANMIVLDGAGEDGRISFMRFLRYGSVVTAATLVVAFALLWAERWAGWL